MNAPRCTKEIDGPKFGRIVAWRRHCRNRTTDPSGRCRFHRGGECWVGESAADHARHRKAAGS